VTPAVLDRPASLLAAPGAAAAERAAGGERSVGAERAAGGERATRPAGGGRVTLEDRLNSVLREARTNGSAECPACHARMTPTSAAAALSGAECGSCGSRLT
jgi:hypothetical protein